jgi:hypothetical protein
MSTRVRKKEILSDDFKKRKIFWKNIAENFPYGKIFYGKCSTSHLYLLSPLAPPWCVVGPLYIYY